jgi:hypothetical protein
VSVAELTVCPPRFATRRTGRETYGGEVARLARLLGFEPMPHQQLFWDVALEHEDGQLVYTLVIWTISRQVGKTVAVFLLMLWRCLKWPAQTVVYAAQTGRDARARLADTWWPTIDHSPLAEVVTFRRQSGHEALIFDNGSRLGLLASSDKSAHGDTIDTAVLDEAWAYPDHRLEQGVRPAMATRENAQLIVPSTAGTEQRSPFLWEKVQAGRQAVETGITEGIAYLEWSAPEDADAGDPETWRAAIPALGATQLEATIRANYLAMPRNEFRRSFLNVWTSTLGDGVIALDVWEGLAAPAAPRPPEVVLAVDVAPRSKSAAIAAAGIDSDGNVAVSVLEYGPGTHWVAGRLTELVAELAGPEIVLDPRACAGLLGELEHLGAVRVDGVALAAGCAFFLDLVQRGRLRHRGERELLVALDGAAQRPMNDGWAWSRRRSGADISPLVACTLGAWAWQSTWSDR